MQQRLQQVEVELLEREQALQQQVTSAQAGGSKRLARVEAELEATRVCVCLGECGMCVCWEGVRVCVWWCFV